MSNEINKKNKQPSINTKMFTRIEVVGSYKMELIESQVYILFIYFREIGLQSKTILLGLSVGCCLFVAALLV